MHKREFGICFGCLREEVFRSKRIELPQLSYSECIKACGIRIKWQRRKYTRFVVSLQRPDAQPVTQLSADLRD